MWLGEDARKRTGTVMHSYHTFRAGGGIKDLKIPDPKLGVPTPQPAKEGATKMGVSAA